MSPDDYMAKAQRAIASARLLLADGDTDGACNRAYYAMFDAAHAALMATTADFNPATVRTHRGLIAAFGQHLIKPGRLSVEIGRSLNQVERVRLLADYTGEPVDAVKTQWAIDQAELFTETVQQLLARSSQEPNDGQ